ncbi:MAG TPA: amidotransferase [Desulfobulbaceae bacterium]|nr:amidotransferase [Desulfobulbaceae bacterium]
MRAHYLQHVAFEGLGSIEPWLREAGYDITATRFFESAKLPGAKELDLLVVMGGPMSVNDEGDYPWLPAEKHFIAEAIRAGVPVLGICLGAQLIAAAMGGRVYPNKAKEIGWLPVHRVSEESADVFRFPDTATVFHWHGETFDLPPGAIRLASSEACANQAFQLGKSVIGLQFHLETTPVSAKSLTDNCRHELVPSPFIQSEGTILAAPASSYQEINGLMANLLSFLTRGGMGNIPASK